VYFDDGDIASSRSSEVFRCIVSELHLRLFLGSIVEFGGLNTREMTQRAIYKCLQLRGV